MNKVAESRPRLFRRSGHLRDPQVAAGHLRLRGHHLHRRHRPGRGSSSPRARRRSRSGVKKIFVEDLREEFVRDFVFPMFRANARLRRRVPPRHLDRAPAHRQAPDRDRAQDRRGRDLPRRDRQGQRPGALRARRLRAHARRDASSRRGANGTCTSRDKLLRYAGQARHPGRLQEEEGRRRALLHGREPAAHLLRGGILEDPTSSRKSRCGASRYRPRRRRTSRNSSISTTCGATSWRSTARRCRRRRCSRS